MAAVRDTNLLHRSASRDIAEAESVSSNMSVVPWQQTSEKPINVPQERSMIRPSLSLVQTGTTETGALLAKPSYTISGKYPHSTGIVSISPHKRKNYTRIVKDFEPLVWEVLDQGLPIVEGDMTDAKLDKVAAKSSSKVFSAPSTAKS